MNFSSLVTGDTPCFIAGALCFLARKNHYITSQRVNEKIHITLVSIPSSIMRLKKKKDLQPLKTEISKIRGINK